MSDASVSTSPFQIHSEARGPHWIAWISRDASQKPYRSVVLVAANQQEAEERARRFAQESQG